MGDSPSLQKYLLQLLIYVYIDLKTFCGKLLCFQNFHQADSLREINISSFDDNFLIIKMFFKTDIR